MSSAASIRYTSGWRANTSADFSMSPSSVATMRKQSSSDLKNPNLPCFGVVDDVYGYFTMAASDE